MKSRSEIIDFQERFFNFYLDHAHRYMRENSRTITHKQMRREFTMTKDFFNYWRKNNRTNSITESIAISEFLLNNPKYELQGDVNTNLDTHDEPYTKFQYERLSDILPSRLYQAFQYSSNSTKEIIDLKIKRDMILLNTIIKDNLNNMHKEKMEAKKNTGQMELILNHARPKLKYV